jgi:hypothetical protein
MQTGLCNDRKEPPASPPADSAPALEIQMTETTRNSVSVSTAATDADTRAALNSDALVFSIALGGYERLFAGCLESQAAYCRRWGYAYTVVRESPRPLRPIEAAWLKIALLRAALAHGYRWVAFIDADCEVREHTPGFVEHLSTLDPNKTIFLAPGFSGRINSGVIFLRNAPSSKELLDTLIANADHEVPREYRTAFENGHMIHFGSGHAALQMLDHRLWNNNSELDASSYIQHYSGYTLRPWYVQNRAAGQGFPVRSESTVQKLIKRIRKRLKKKLGLLPRRLPGLTRRMEELQRHYERVLPVFQPRS